MSARFRKNAGWTAAAIAGMALAVPAQAVVVVDWNGSEHGGRGGFFDDSRDFSRSVEVTVGDFNDDGVDDTQILVPFSLVESMNPAIEPPSYNDVDSAIFYGGQKYTFYGVADPEGDDVSYTRRYNRNRYLQTIFSGNASIANFYLWDKSDFLNDGDSGIVSLDATSSLNYDRGAGVNNATVRFVVRTADDQYFISESFANAPSTFSLSGQDLVNEMWASYDPNVDIEFDLGSADFNTSTASLSNIAGFGVYADDRDSSTSTFSLHRFTVDAVIPEPASIGLMLGGAALMLLRRRSQEA